MLSKQREKINRSEFLTYYIQKEQKTIVFCSFCILYTCFYLTNGGFVTLALTF